MTIGTDDLIRRSLDGVISSEKPKPKMAVAQKAAIVVGILLTVKMASELAGIGTSPVPTKDAVNQAPSSAQESQEGSLGSIAYNVGGSYPLQAKALAGPTEATAAKVSGDAAALEVRRHIAVKHKLVLLAPAADLQKIHDDLLAQCQRMGCEVETSSMVPMAPEDQGAKILRLANFDLDLRLPPEHVEAFLTGVTSRARLVHHILNASDKTAEVIDTEAQIKNLTAYRDRLREMLKQSRLTITNTLEINQALVGVQSQLDASTAMRKQLSKDTDWVSISLNVESEYETATTTRNPILVALRGAGKDIQESTAVLISFITSTLPWGVAGGLAWIFVGASHRFLKRRRDKKTDQSYAG